jgi:hypothetical protein
VFCELTTLTAKAGDVKQVLACLESSVAGPRLLGCWHTVLGNQPRIFVLSRAERVADHEVLRAQAVGNLGLFGLDELITSISVDTYATLPCLPDIQTGAFGAFYEIRTYELQPTQALGLAHQGWADVIDVRLGLAPITTVMHSVDGLIPRLVHIYPYRDLAERQQIRDAAIATGFWPPKGGANRNQVMRTEIAVPASFSPIC